MPKLTYLLPSSGNRVTTPLTDGQRIKKTAGSTATYYPFAHYEISPSLLIKYYYFNGQRIAQRNGSTLYYLHGDQLGSTVVTTSGVNATRQYYAYGRLRGYSGSFPSRYQFTGQYIDDSGLYYYNARYYDSTIGTFISPDTVVPDATNLFDYNRYMYVRGNPLRYNDPTGNYSNDEIMKHFGCDSWGCVEDHFKEGGSLAGAWGWLNVLQAAQDGDTVTATMLTQIEGQSGSTNASLLGSILRGGNGRIGVHLQAMVGADYHQSALDATLDGDAFAQFAKAGTVGMYGVQGGTTYSHDAQAVCYTGMQCATQALDAASTGASAVAAVCLGSVVGAPCAGVASNVSLVLSGIGTGLTVYSATQGEASALDVGVGLVTTTVGGKFGAAGKGTVGFMSSLLQWWWDQ